MSDLRHAGQHPDADQLNAFIEHTLPEHEQEQTMAHLAICPTCREIVVLARPPVDELPVATPVPVRRFPPLRVVWVAIPALAALIVLGIFIRRPDTPKHTTTAPTQMADLRSAAAANVAPAPAPEPAPTPSAPLVAARHSAPRPANPKQEVAAADRLTAVPPSASAPVGVMGGILGGVGTGPTDPQDAPSGGFAPATAMSGRTSFFPVANLLPSNLAIVSMASHANERVAIDANHQLFFSDDNGRHWKAIVAPWKGRAVRVALASAAGNATLPLHQVARRLAAPPLVSRAAPLTASATSATLSGTITDPTGATVQGATVNAIEFGSVVSSGTSDNEGKFRIENLPPGSYRVEAQAPGFLKQSSVTEIAPAHPATVDFTLQVGSVTQTVNVQTASPALDTVLVAPATPGLAQFEITTDDGQRWVSDDGQTWKPK
jgi:hypothetical protein